MLDLRTRQAIANLARQSTNPNPKKPDPLSVICEQRRRQIRKAKMIMKRKKYLQQKRQRRQRQRRQRRMSRQGNKISASQNINVNTNTNTNTRIVDQNQPNKIPQTQKQTQMICQQKYPQKNNKQIQTQIKNQVQQHRPKISTRKINQTPNTNWLKYLPNQCDNFSQNQHQQQNNNTSMQVNYSNIETKIQNTYNNNNNHILGPQYNSLLQSLSRLDQQPKRFKNQSRDPSKNLKNAQFSESYYEMLKSKLGIKIQEQVKVKVEEKKQVEILKDSPNSALLPFAGRKFEQAPPRPQPKKIWEYPPTCKVAGLYEWPPPKSQFRKWKNQMRESRKLK